MPHSGSSSPRRSISHTLSNTLIKLVVRLRRLLREREAAFIVLAAIAGALAGLSTNLLSFIAHAMQQVFYGLEGNRLSALAEIRHPWRLLALPLGGLVLALWARWLRRRNRPLIDVVEANALHGGRIPPADNLIIAGQTVISNGVGASVGLEAAYAQMGGGMASVLGQAMKLRRNDLRTLVGAGAGAAVGAAFNAPLAGAFYAFEIVIGSFVPGAVAPVMAAALAAAGMSRLMGSEPWLIATTAVGRSLTFEHYLAYGVLGLAAAVVGIIVMRLVTAAELTLARFKWLARWRPILGGFLLVPLALLTPQSLSAGHGALHLNLALRPGLDFLGLVLLAKIAACVVALSSGFRGGLFFASLFLGSVVGQAFSIIAGQLFPGLSLDPTDAALVGMAALSVSIVGGPMTLAMLMLEITHDFALMGVVLTASLVSGTLTREVFGYSFSTWRLHVRGSNIRGPRDIGWMLNLSAGRIMRRDWVSMPEDLTIEEFRTRMPLGSASKAVLVDDEGHYRGIMATAAAYRPDLAPDMRLHALAGLTGVTLGPASDIKAVLALFDEYAADEIAVVDGVGVVQGVITERHARRRYLEEVEAAQRSTFSE
ncbi:CIC family chloride channel protein [Novosphingobium sp. 1529]|uniref:chloride channel protein n=1 Tax=Novosphingobium TaxID=165696 RepID=UPI0009E97CE8|nr:MULTISPECIES: chloride channel protein [Novosphingobium]MBB3480033.1 CIC family chloride channel protein [Novosphingobium sp. BK369]MBB3623120.1 CIC family chloride channel protein [Novosphingobium sp. BK592]NOX07706.1 CIC family chloride channel protein [Novosphingobium sp. SG754]PTR08633.1 CIC family chloride channel protein [Novosphingobium sp. GV055]PUB01356.1 CIC family chloride channel protein [Novosphingobium sp. GV061]